MLDTPIDFHTLAEHSATAWEAGIRMLQPWRFGETDEAHVEVLLDTLDAPIGARVLDVGCGFGETARLMSQFRPDMKFVLLNAVAEQLDRAPEKFERVCADAHDLPFETESFDVVMFHAALCNMDARVALAEASRVLKPGGILLLNELRRVDGDNCRLESWAGARAYPHDPLRAFAKAFGLTLSDTVDPEFAYAYLRDLSEDPAEYDEAFAGVVPGLWRFTRDEVLPVAARVATTISRHDRIALQFSGGKDSLATLYLLRPWWDRLCVYWLNTGDAYPENVARAEQIRSEVPYFREVRGRQPEIVAADGWPADVVPHLNTSLGNLVFGPTEFKVQSRLDCCWRSLMVPLDEATRADGTTLIIRGKRDDEADRTGVKTGDVYGGIEMLFPILDWTADEVFAYLDENGIPLPHSYNHADSSLDCMSCTAWLEHKNGAYLKAEYPDKYTEHERRLRLIRTAIDEQIKGM